MTKTTIGIVGTSRKENEHRVPIHPDHLDRIAPARRTRLAFEEGYGRRFGVADEEIEAAGSSLATREELLRDCEIVILPKPTAADLREVRKGGVVWGWPHCVQQRELTQIAIDRELTLIAWEAMFQWSRTGTRGVHVFARNNELAGYCGILDALRLRGVDGAYGPRQRVAVLGFGSVSRGAASALQGRGFSDLTVFTQRPPHLVRDRLFGARHLQMRRTGENGAMEAVDAAGNATPLAEALGGFDVIANGTLQDPERPVMYLGEGDEDRLRPGCLIVDVSCDRGMGFPFARPTSFEDPTFRAGPATYYAVDHTPSYLYAAASWEISEALLPYLPAVMGGSEAWQSNETVRRAIEIRDGRVVNPTILSFQDREPEYPHRFRLL